ncbi:hypothetical protein B0H10DRAFT_1969737 [Mycena sp. CBHHK59/15]|nr:hypothetical protein B0H10DRAFT_1969737 [Mycena sp. CBHHK59/15]
MARVKAKKERRNERVKNTRTKDRKFKRRVNAIAYAIEQKTLSDPELPTYNKYFEKLVAKLGKDGMSSEEEEIAIREGKPQVVYGVKLCAWRANPIDGYLDAIDLVADAQKNGGAPRALRQRGTKVGTSNPPNGLPEKMYGEVWLAQKRKSNTLWVEKQLRVSDEPFELLAKGKGKERAKE